MALAAAALFGLSMPFAKLLLGSIDPWLLAGLFYLRSGLGLPVVQISGRLTGLQRIETPLRRGDLPWLGAVVLAGGIAGPVLLLFGLAATEAASAALLLNLEGLATMAIAWLVFRESVDRRLLTGALAILAGAVLLSWQTGGAGFGLGAVLVAGACLAWGIDNNLTRKLSAADPIQIVTIKGLVAGSVNLALAASQGASLSGAAALLGAGVLGLVSYGLSLVLFVLALQHLGTARTGAYFSTAPFIGAAAAVEILVEPLSAELVLAGGLMAVGVWLHLTERHEHEHAHEALTHDHRHVHDEHHDHGHRPADPAGEPHSHMHLHRPMRHKHPHYPDLHHRHVH